MPLESLQMPIHMEEYRVQYLAPYPVRSLAEGSVASVPHWWKRQNRQLIFMLPFDPIGRSRVSTLNQSVAKTKKSLPFINYLLQILSSQLT